MANSQSYEGRVPPAKGTGPRNLPKTPAEAMPTRRVRAKASRASVPKVNPRRASSGYSPPAGAGSGIAKPSTPMATPPRKTINKPKVGRPPNTRKAAKPRADFPSKI